MRIWCLLALAACGRSSTEPETETAPRAPVVAATAAFVDVTVVTMDGDRVLPHQTVLVNADRIVAIGPADRTAVAPGATRIAGAGKWLVPGLVDMHVHFNDPGDGVLFIANGVTTVRNMWGNPDTLTWRERAKKDPTWPGPSIYTAGPIVDGNPPRWPGSTVLESPAAAEAEAAAEKTAGYDFIKVYDGLALDVYDALAAAARAHGIRFAGHVPKAVPLAHALAAGQASIEHMTGFLLAVQDDTSKAATMTWPAQGAELIAHVDPARIPAVARATREAGTAVVPTLVVLSRFGALDHPEVLAARPEVKYVSPALVASWNPTQDFRLKTATAETYAVNRDANVARTKILTALIADGVQVLAGTDTPNPFVVPGFALHEELELLVAAGMTPAQALRAATAAPAAWLGASKELGTIAIGARADLVLLDADPLAAITATRQQAGVMVRGTWYTHAALAAKLDERVSSFAPRDRFVGVPELALDADAGAAIATAEYILTYQGVEVAQERLAVQKTAAGGRIIVAQSAGDLPSPALQSVRIDLAPDGALAAFSIDRGAVGRAVVTRTKAGFHAVVSSPGGADAASNLALARTTLLDADLVATMMPFADRALRGKPGAKVTVKGQNVVALGPPLALSELGYTFTLPARGGTTVAFTATSKFGTAAGTYAVDDHGIPTSITLDTPQGTIAITRR